MSTPAKIIKSIVVSISIEVARFMPWGARTDEGHQDKSVDKESLPSSWADAKREGNIFSAPMSFNYFPVFPSSFAVVGDFVIWMACYFFPSAHFAQSTDNGSYLQGHL